MLGCRGRLGTERGHAVSVGDLCHPKGERSQGHNLHGLWQSDETTTQFAALLDGPRPGESATSGGHDTLGESIEVKVGSSWFMLLEDLKQIGTRVIGEEVAEKMVVE